jgi:hypothetical protein
VAANALGAIALAGEAAVHLQQYAAILHGVRWIGQPGRHTAHPALDHLVASDRGGSSGPTARVGDTHGASPFGDDAQPLWAGVASRLCLLARSADESTIRKIAGPQPSAPGLTVLGVSSANTTRRVDDAVPLILRSARQ